MTNYIINPIYFYLAEMAETTKGLFLIGGIFAAGITAALLIFWMAENAIELSNMDDDEKITFKKYKKIIIIGLILFFIGAVMPSKETCIQMMISSKITYENVSETEEEVYKFVDYMTDKLNASDEE